MRRIRLTLTIALATGLVGLSAIAAAAGAGKTAFTQTDLVSDIPGRAMLPTRISRIPGAFRLARTAQCGSQTTGPASPPSTEATV
jgi:hypothetical protein